jgi:bacillopeptidase F
LRPQGPDLTSQQVKELWAHSSIDPGDEQASSSAASGDTRTLIVQLSGEANLQADDIHDQLLRATVRSMTTAGPALDALKGAGLITDVDVMPLSQMLLVEVPVAQASESFEALNKVPGVSSVMIDGDVSVDPIDEQPAVGTTQRGDDPDIAWNVEKVRAPEAWAQGIDGKGVTVGIVDTGVKVDHPALEQNYRGYRADGTMDHAYNAYDAVNGSKTPYDDNGHGTHVAGTILGNTADKNVGMAPGAEFIVAKNLGGSRGSGKSSSTIRALEWMMAPRDLNGKNPDPSKAPDIINNSWGRSDGRYDGYRNLWTALDAAGITIVSAAGNDGPGRGTLGAPGSYNLGITVAATDSRDNIASFSSRGPTPWKYNDGSPSFVPDVSAPGVSIESSTYDGRYGLKSGTSMATPGVAGVTALLLSKFPDLSTDEVNQVLRRSAVDRGPEGYDDSYGFGRVDVMAALDEAERMVDERR